MSSHFWLKIDLEKNTKKSVKITFFWRFVKKVVFSKVVQKVQRHCTFFSEFFDRPILLGSQNFEKMTNLRFSVFQKRPFSGPLIENRVKNLLFFLKDRPYEKFFLFFLKKSKKSRFFEKKFFKNSKTPPERLRSKLRY